MKDVRKKEMKLGFIFSKDAVQERENTKRSNRDIRGKGKWDNQRSTQSWLWSWKDSFLPDLWKGHSQEWPRSPLEVKPDDNSSPDTGNIVQS